MFVVRQLVFVLIILVILHVKVSVATEGKLLVHSFANKTSVSPFYFTNGPEYPGATGSLSIISDGFNGNSARISYNLTSGTYVGAIYTFPTPLTFSKITLAIRYACSQNFAVSMRLIDSTGQTFQMSGFNMPFDSLLKGWTQVYYQLNNATATHFGGANDGIFHTPFKQMWLMFGLGEKITSTVGCFDFDNIYALNETQPIVLNLTNRVDVPWAGDMLSKMGVTLHSANTLELNATKEAGFKTIRRGISWSIVEQTRGVYNMESINPTLSLLKERNMTMLYLLSYGNSLYNSESGGFNATTIEAFANYSRYAAKYLSGTGTMFEVYNEADGHGFTGTTYAPLDIAAIKAIHEVDPSAQVTTSGLSQFDYTFLINELIGGAGQEADAIGLHPYGVGYKSGVGSMVEGARRYKSYIDMYLKSTRNPVPPVWDTEMGISSTDNDPSGGTNGHDPVALRIQANRVVERLLASLAVGFQMINYYDLRNDGNDPNNREHNFGLLFNNYTAKPAFKAVKQLSSMVRGKIFDSFIKTSPSPLTAMRFANENETLVIVFAQMLNVKAKLELVQSPKLIFDLFGNALSATDNSLSLVDTDGAIYLLYNNEKVTPTTSPIVPKTSSSSNNNTSQGETSNRVVGNSVVASDGISHRVSSCFVICMILLIFIIY